MKKNIGIIFGGNSVEHEISIITAIQAIENMDQEKYEVIPIYLTKNNKFFTSEDFLNIDIFKNLKEIEKKYKEKILYKEDNKVLLLNKKKSFFKSKDQVEIDIFFPIVHGTNVEDGKLQGYLNMFGIPIIGTTTTSGVIGQEKSIMKDILSTHQIKQTKYLWVKETQREELQTLIEQKLNYPVIVKPNCLGSSIGIFIAKDYEALNQKIDTAFKYDAIVIIEEVLQDFEELNISVVDINDEIKVSAIEKVNASQDLLSYEDKYLSESGKQKMKTSGMESLKRELPAKISFELQQNIEKIARDCYKFLRCQGIIRIDMMVKDNIIYINEVNNIPGSLAFYLWEESGQSYQELLTEVIEDNIKKYYKTKNKDYSFSTNVLNLSGKKINK
ncbi:MAG: hypothetical protein ACK5HR_02110 [Mycoplasmatales bacterium]